jgi:hypothetical protein
MIALAALHLLQHDAVEEHGQFGGVDLQTRWPVAGRQGKAKDAFFEALILQPPAVLLPGEELEAIPRAVAEDEPVSREGIVAESLTDEGAEAVEGLAQIDGGQAEKKCGSPETGSA